MGKCFSVWYQRVLVNYYFHHPLLGNKSQNWAMVVYTKKLSLACLLSSVYSWHLSNGFMTSLGHKKGRALKTLLEYFTTIFQHHQQCVQLLDAINRLATPSRYDHSWNKLNKTSTTTEIIIILIVTNPTGCVWWGYSPFHFPLRKSGSIMYLYFSHYI